MIEQQARLLPVVHFDQEHSWNSLLDLCGGQLDDKGLERLQRLLEVSVACVVVEHHYLDRDYRDTFSGFHSKKFVTPPGRTTRLHFFRTKVTAKQLRARDAVAQESYVGYSVIRPTRPNCIGRTFLDPTKIDRVKGTLCRCTERTSIQGFQLSLTGFPFISQDGDVTVCAEAATWMVLRYFSNRFSTYREHRPFELTRLVPYRTIDDRALSSHGLHLWEMAGALRSVGFAPRTYTRSSFRDERFSPGTFEDLLYTYIESGFPVFAALDKHVVVGIGHWSDYSRPLPTDVPLVKTSFFNRGFIVNDDNTFPYQRIEEDSEASFYADFLKSKRPLEADDPLRSEYSVSDINAFAVPLPEKMFLPAEEFGSLAQKLLFSDTSPIRITEQSPMLSGKPIVVRQYLTTCKSYKERIPDRDSMGNPLVADIYYEIPLPHFIWVCELSTPEHYNERGQFILGEIIWDATRNGHEPGGFLAVHYPEKLWVDLGSVLNRRTDLKKWLLTVSEPYPVFKSNLLEIRP